MDKFVKVKWLEPPHSIEYGTIPSNWIQEKNDNFWVCWPPVPNVKPLILKRQLPKKDWFRFILLKKYGSGSKFKPYITFMKQLSIFYSICIFMFYFFYFRQLF